MKAIKFKESEYYSIELPRGLFLIDENPTSLDNYTNKVQVKDLTSVIPITRTTLADYYLNGDNKLSVQEYNSKRDDLLKNRIVNEDGDTSWKSLEDEFAYRKFITTWVAINKEIEIKGDPYTFEIVESQIETGNPFIKSDYINGGKDPLLFIYNRPSAVLEIVRNKFTSLGMVYQEGISYSNTANKKVWGNSTHSCIRYVTAFGNYIFNNSWEITNSIRGTLDDLLAKYKSDKETLENIIQTRYNLRFGKIDSGNFNFEALLTLLNHCRNSLTSMEVKTKSYDFHRTAKSKLNEAIQLIETSYKELNIDGNKD